MTSSQPAPSSAPPLTCYAQTMPGVEKITWLEIRWRLPRARFGEYLFAEEQNGIVLFDYGGPLVELLQLRTAEDLFLLALSIEKVTRDWGDLRLIAEQIQQADLFGFAMNTLRRYRKLGGTPTYRVVSRKYGQHQYRRMDFEEAVVKAVDARYGHRWRRVAEDADVEIWANLFGSRVLIGLRLTDRTMRHRYEKNMELPASLRPSVAAAMVLLTEPEPGDIFLDPMCGSGTLLMERALAAPFAQLLGGDVARAPAEIAQRNVDNVAGQGTVVVSRWDGCALPMAGGSVGKIATNLPFGKQVGSPASVKQLYPCFLAEVQRVLRPGGRAVVLSSEYELVKEVTRNLSGLEIMTGYSIAVLGQWGRIYILKRHPPAAL